MAGQLEELLYNVSRELSAATADLATAMRRVEELAREHGAIRERIRALEIAAERDLGYGEREHDALRARLTEGDKLFGELSRAARAATEAAGVAQRAADSAQLRVKDLREKIDEADKLAGGRRWDLVQLAITSAISLVAWLLLQGGTWAWNALRKAAP